MSQENVALHRRSLEAFNARDTEAAIALCDPGIELQALPAPRGTVYHGHEGVRAWNRDLEETWGDEICAEPAAYFDLGERTALFFVLHARGRESGVQVSMQSASVVRWRNGVQVYVKVYASWEDALTDLDISQDALEEIAP